jgi:hypothetical protein
MSLPANIRVNVGAPFPATVKGSSGIAIGRANGIWTVGLAYPQLGVQNPPAAANYATDYVVIYDSIAATYFTVPLTGFGAGGSLAQRAITAGPVAILPTDIILNLNLTASQTITLPLAVTRHGVPLVFKDIGLHAAVFPITIAAVLPDTIDGVASMPLNAKGQRLTFTPANDGVNSGWSL